MGISNLANQLAAVKDKITFDNKTEHSKETKKVKRYISTLYLSTKDNKTLITKNRTGKVGFFINRDEVIAAYKEHGEDFLSMQHHMEFVGPSKSNRAFNAKWLGIAKGVQNA